MQPVAQDAGTVKEKVRATITDKIFNWRDIVLYVSALLVLMVILNWFVFQPCNRGKIEKAAAKSREERERLMEKQKSLDSQLIYNAFKAREAQNNTDEYIKKAEDANLENVKKNTNRDRERQTIKKQIDEIQSNANTLSKPVLRRDRASIRNGYDSSNH